MQRKIAQCAIMRAPSGYRSDHWHLMAVVTPSTLATHNNTIIIVIRNEVLETFYD